MVDETSDRYRKKLEEIKRVANQSADMHSAESDRHQRWSQGLSSGVLLSSAFLLSLSFVSEDFIQRTIGLNPDWYKWVVGLLAFVTFSLTLVSLAWRPSAKAASHGEAVSHYVRAKHDVDLALRVDSPVTRDAVDQIVDRYLSDGDITRIPDRRFNKLKRRHLTKKAVSTALSENPHRAIWRIRRTLEKSSRQHPIDRN